MQFEKRLAHFNAGDLQRVTWKQHPTVRAIRNDLEHQVLAGTLFPEAAARQILQAFGLE
jgi:hypothetical protein